VKMHHVGLTVTDIETAVDFYTGVLGAKVQDRIEPDDHTSVRRLVGVPDARIVGRMLVLDSGERVELLSYRSEHRRRLDVRPCDAPSAHLAFAVPDLDAAMEAVSRHGGRLVGGPVSFDAGTFVYCADVDGNLLELIEEVTEQTVEGE
jgi:catechol 2,3-dioxygenase-like lactoylglutathione lyase family enzyme